jgi:hypothetical protein
MSKSRHVTASSIFQQLWNYGNVLPARRAVLGAGENYTVPGTIFHAIIHDLESALEQYRLIANYLGDESSAQSA